MIPFHEVLLRLFFAAGIGALIGVERDLRRRPAGIRTSMFVCLATALFTIISQELSQLWGDTSPTRIASNIVASEVHSLLANMKIPMRQFRVSGTGNNAVVEFEADVSNHQEEQIIAQLSREGVVSEVVPYEVRP